MASRDPSASPLLLQLSDDEDYQSHASSPFTPVSVWCKSCNWINTCKCKGIEQQLLRQRIAVTFTSKVMKMPLTKSGQPDKRFKYVKTLE
jgi:hypothetical protein